MAIDYKKLAVAAAEKTDQQFATTIAELTSFKADEVLKIITKTGISKPDFANLVNIVKDKAMDNEQKAEALQQINKGMQTVISIAGKFL